MPVQLLHLLKLMYCCVQPITYHVYVCTWFTFLLLDHIILNIPYETNENQSRGKGSVFGELPRNKPVGDIIDMAKIVCVQCSDVVYIL